MRKTIAVLLLFVLISLLCIPVSFASGTTYYNLNTGKYEQSLDYLSSLAVDGIFKIIKQNLYNPYSAEIKDVQYYYPQTASNNDTGISYFLITITAQNRIGGQVTESYFGVCDWTQKGTLEMLPLNDIVIDPNSVAHRNTLYVGVLKCSGQFQEYISDFYDVWTANTK